MNDYRDQIKNLAFTVNDGLTTYITIHNRILQEGATFKSVFKNIFGRAAPMSQLFEDVESLIPLWNSINDKIAAFGSEVYSSMDKDERYYFNILDRYAQAVNETVVALVESQKLLKDRNKSDQNNPVTWIIFRESEKKYDSAIKKYMVIGQELNNASHLVF